MLARNVWFLIPIVCSMLLGFAGVCLSVILNLYAAKVNHLSFPTVERNHCWKRGRKSHVAFGEFSQRS